MFHYQMPYLYPYQMPYQYQMPEMSQMPMLNPQYLCNQVRPLVRYGLEEAKVTGVPHAMTEVTLIAYLMGMGYPLQRAHALVEYWEHQGYWDGQYETY